MNKLKSIATIIIASYILLLPAIFGLHFVHHDAQCIHTIKQSNDFDYLESQDECHLCELFFGQEAKQESPILFSNRFNKWFESIAKREHLFSTKPSSYQLRAPPAA